MADDTSKTSTTKEAANTATTGDHDRVQLLSLHGDGSHDQLNPELIGDAETTLAATKEQFKQQAVSAVDAEKRRALVEGPADTPQDPTVEDLKKAHDAAASAAEKAAESAVKGLSS
jgi:hypothetical protein